MSITLQTEGRRVYAIGNTFALKDAIRAAGGHWDDGRKAWWVGVANRTVLERAVATLASPSEQPSREAPGAEALVAGKATYKGKTYYLAGRIERGRTHRDDRVAPIHSGDGRKVLLYSLDGSIKFWAPLQQYSDRVKVADINADPNCAQTQKLYSKPQTIGALAEFSARNKREAKDTGIDCPVCRRIEREQGQRALQMHLHDGCDRCGAEG